MVWRYGERTLLAKDAFVRFDLVEAKMMLLDLQKLSIELSILDQYRQGVHEFCMTLNEAIKRTELIIERRREVSDAKKDDSQPVVNNVVLGGTGGGNSNRTA
jgi:hypothetical protein